ncbi:MAG TPA: phytanoyl-CoA dioxygenase [Burkholderiaceae bacterium]|nr:phytanoyl-CoA dioxygenase [Burkholderiaceae bacterium]
MSHSLQTPRGLSDAQVHQFIHDGFVRIDQAFPRRLAEEAQAILWPDTGCDPNDPATWTRPVIRLGMYSQEPFVAAANTPVLHAAFDQLVGVGRWLPRTSMGTFPVRFPSPDDPGDAGWHIDLGFDHDKPDFMDWRANIVSRGRALLMLLLFSDVGESDAPTRIRIGSHHDAARMLAPAGDEGLTTRELCRNGFDETAGRPEVLATGDAGTVYLCHPFLVHAAQIHRGTRPRFLAQPPLLARDGVLNLARSEADTSPVEAAIRLALAGDQTGNRWLQR